MDDEVELLTPREMDVLKLIAKGFTDSEIAHILGISYTRAVNNGVAIRSKLGARNRVHAVIIAVRRGLVQIT